MRPAKAGFRRWLPSGLVLAPLGRFQFYDAAKTTAVALVIATAEQRIYANKGCTLVLREANKP